VDGPICVLWKGKRTEAWYHLSDQEAADLLQKDSETIRRLGGRNVVSCDSRWSSEQWEWFGIDEMPTLEAHLAHIDALEEVHFFQFWDVEFTVATKVTSVDD
jgi:hypothetical protein